MTPGVVLLLELDTPLLLLLFEEDKVCPLSFEGGRGSVTFKTLGLRKNLPPEAEST